MLVLFDREPPGLSRLTLTLPAHQQTFVAAFLFEEDSDIVEMHYKRIYATGANEPLPVGQKELRESLEVPLSETRFSRSQIIDWDARTLKIQGYADDVHDKLGKYMPETGGKQYKADTPTSAVLVLQLNEPIYTLDITASLPDLSKMTGTDDVFDAKLPSKKEDINTWDMLHDQESEIFQFIVPAFPAEKYRPTESLQAPQKSVLFKPPIRRSDHT